jgi:hypothetical protein
VSVISMFSSAIVIRARVLATRLSLLLDEILTLKHFAHVLHPH